MSSTLRFAVQRLLDERECSQLWLVRETGIAQNTVNSICCNRTVRVDLATLAHLADALDVDVGQLFDRVPTSPRRKRKPAA